MPRKTASPAERIAKIKADAPLAANAVKALLAAIEKGDQENVADAAKFLEAFGCYARRTDLPAPAPAAIPAATQRLHVCGPNLRDQSQGSFVVHAAGCRDAVRLARKDPAVAEELRSAPKGVEFSTLIEVAKHVYDNGIMEDDETGAAYLSDFNFCPCVKLPVE